MEARLDSQFFVKTLKIVMKSQKSHTYRKDET